MANGKNAEALQYIENLTSNAREIQQKVLAEILNQNTQTEYLQRFKIGNATDPQTFKSNIPIIRYEDIKSDLQRIANGDRSPIFTVNSVSEFFMSTGTSGGEPKLIPIDKEDWDRRMKMHGLIPHVIESYVPELNNGQGLFFRFVVSEKITPGGILCRSPITKMYKSDFVKKLISNSESKFTSPIEAIVCTDYFQSMYTQMLCGLYNQQEVIRVSAPFASGLLRAIRFLQLNWQDLAHDIRFGSLNQKITDVSIQQAIAQRLNPNLDIADFIVRECSKENWEGIISRIWPQAKFIQTTITGSMAQYIPMLDYYSSGLPIVSQSYGSSECEFGINLSPMCKPTDVSYTIMSNIAYFEFIPHENRELNSPLKTVDLVDVEVGKEYEMIVTTYSGLYRYQMGDILRVTGFYNSTPQFHFVRRKNTLLSVDMDKTDETELQKGIDSASQILGEIKIQVMDYISYASIKEIPGHYIIYLELFQNDLGNLNLPSDDVMSQCCLAIENSLSSWYRKLRSANSVGAMEIRVLKSGTFSELMEVAISKGASASQYKVPRVTNLESTVSLLDSRVVSAHFSKTLPRQTMN